MSRPSPVAVESTLFLLKLPASLSKSAIITGVLMADAVARSVQDQLANAKYEICKLAGDKQSLEAALKAREVVHQESIDYLVERREEAISELSSRVEDREAKLKEAVDELGKLQGPLLEETQRLEARRSGLEEERRQLMEQKKKLEEDALVLDGRRKALDEERAALDEQRRQLEETWSKETTVPRQDSADMEVDFTSNRHGKSKALEKNQESERAIKTEPSASTSFGSAMSRLVKSKISAPPGGPSTARGSSIPSSVEGTLKVENPSAVPPIYEAKVCRTPNVLPRTNVNVDHDEVIEISSDEEEPSNVIIIGSSPSPPDLRRFHSPPPNLMNLDNETHPRPESPYLPQGTRHSRQSVPLDVSYLGRRQYPSLHADANNKRKTMSMHRSSPDALTKRRKLEPIHSPSSQRIHSPQSKPFIAKAESSDRATSPASWRSSVKPVFASSFPPIPSITAQIPTSLKDRVASFECIKVPASLYIPSPTSPDVGCFSRTYIGEIIGGSHQTLVANIELCHRALKPRHRAIFPQRVQNPGLPYVQGTPGTILASRFDVLGFTSLFIRAEHLSKAVWLYFGEYELEKSKTDLSGDEFQRLPVKDTSEAAVKAAADTLILTKKRLVKRPSYLIVSTEDVLKAMDCRDEKLSVIMLRPVSFDVDLHEHLCSRTSASSPSQTPKSTPEPKSKHKERVAARRESDVHACNPSMPESTPEIRRSARCPVGVRKSYTIEGPDIDEDNDLTFEESDELIDYEE
ncbi:hypothetical protein OF83DRAFT_1175307 [Amylostereum chailletii]|nr:hypothetical protein OF83DRAFT_1175307 [Amylostereum chailletii]